MGYSPGFGSFIQHALLSLTLEMSTKKARGYLLSQFRGRTGGLGNPRTNFLGASQKLWRFIVP